MKHPIGLFILQELLKIKSQIEMNKYVTIIIYVINITGLINNTSLIFWNNNGSTDLCTTDFLDPLLLPGNKGSKGLLDPLFLWV